MRAGDVVAILSNGGFGNIYQKLPVRYCCAKLRHAKRLICRRRAVWGMLQDGMFATFKLVFVYLALGPIAGIIGIPYTLLVGDISLLYRVAMWITNAGVRAAGIKIEMSGLENIPAGRSCIFMSNHVSNLDPPVVLPLLPGRSSVLLKKELMNIPILGKRDAAGEVCAGGAGPPSRCGPGECGGRCGRASRPGCIFWCIRRGPVRRDGRLSTFKKGPFFLAQETQAPIIPIALSGTQTMMHKGSNAIVPGVARIQLLPAIEPSKYETREELMAAVRSAIAEALPPEMKPAAI